MLMSFEYSVALNGLSVGIGVPTVGQGGEGGRGGGFWPVIIRYRYL